MSSKTNPARGGDETVVAAQASFDGKLEGSDITLHGRFKGELKASGIVRILEGSVVDARLDAHRVDIGGRFQGEVSAKTLRILANARASGTFRADKLGVEEGGQLEGEFEVGSSSPAPSSRRESGV